MLDFAVALRQPGAHFFRVILERPVAAFVGDTSAFVNNVEPLRPGRVGVVRSIVHFIDTEGQREFEALSEIVGDRNALGKRLRLNVADIVFIFFVRRHSPFVDGMRFANVDRQKIDMVFVIVIDLRDNAQLAPEGWSSKAAKNQHQRSPAGAIVNPVVNLEASRAIQRHQTRVGRIVTYF